MSEFWTAIAIFSYFVFPQPNYENDETFEVYIREHAWKPRPPAAEEPPPKKKVWLPTIACRIKWVESSGGTRRYHPWIKRGVNRGTRAVSSYGMMPLTVKELLSTGFKNTKTGKLVAKAKTPAEINRITEDEYHDDVAFQWHWKTMYYRIKKMTTTLTLETALLAHYAGVTGAMRYRAKHGDEGLKNHRYVRKVLAVRGCR